MNCLRFLKLNVLLYSLLVLLKRSSGQICDTNGLNCISCSEYKICGVGSPQERVVSCETGKGCGDNPKQCQTRVYCYALNECTQTGIFQDTMVDSNYFVCISDEAAGFFKYEFSCQDGFFFDRFGKACVERSITATDVIDPAPSTEPSSTTTSSPAPSTEPSSTTTSSPAPSTEPSSTTTSSPAPSTEPSSTTTSSPAPSPEPSPSPTSSPTPSPEPSPSPTSSPTPSPEPSPTTSSPAPSPTSSPTPSPFPSTVTPPFLCPGPGIFPNTDNCKMYYRCSTSLKYFIYICPGRSYFNENILKCSLQITPKCQEQILKNSTSTSTSIPSTQKPILTTVTPTNVTTTSTTTTTTTTTIITTTPSTPPTTTTVSTPTTPTPPFSCQMSGIFENPSDCKTYYRCSTSLNAFLYTCPGTSYFNEITKRCSLTLTPRCKALIQG